MIDTAGNKMVVAMAPYLNGETGPDRLLALAVPAAREALAAVRNRRPPVRVTIALPPARPGQPAMGKTITKHLADSLRDTVPIHTLKTIELGHAAGFVGLESVCTELQAGQDDLQLIGGVDSYLEPETLEWLESCDQLHAAGSSNNAWGFIPGEAAGFCLLASPSACDRYELTGRCRVRTAVTAGEKNLIKTDTVCLGIGLTEVWRRALAALPDGDKVDKMICDLNGEPYRADEFGFALARTSERFVSGSNFLAPADCWGDVGAASAPLFVGLAAAAAERRYAVGRHCLIWASSESGERGAALLQLDVNSRAGG
jgi:3-oxoacyl-[acyl-carrier-protein] synthase-1